MVGSWPQEDELEIQLASSSSRFLYLFSSNLNDLFFVNQCGCIELTRAGSCSHVLVLVTYSCSR